jgi:hypothetical protein
MGLYPSRRADTTLWLDSLVEAMAEKERRKIRSDATVGTV